MKFNFQEYLEWVEAQLKEAIHEQQQTERAFGWGDERTNQAEQEVYLRAYYLTGWDADADERWQTRAMKGTTQENLEDAAWMAVVFLSKKGYPKR